MQITGTENRELMAQARAALRGQWGLGVAVTFLYLSLAIVVQSVHSVGSLIWLIIAGPFTLGLAGFNLTLSRGKPARFQDVFEGFNRFGVALGVHFLRMLFVLLWALLLIIPGIIAALAYSMAFYVLADNPSCGVVEALRRSKEMMRGRKWKLTCLLFRFFGWLLLTVISLGIGLLWLVPYISVAMAAFYEDVKPAPAAADEVL
jgi:uncharacterized membrane protein